MVVCEYALDQLESKHLVEVFELRTLPNTLPNRQRSSKIANASQTAGPSTCVNLFRRVIDSSSLESSMQRSSSTTLLTTNITNWRSVAAAVEDITAISINFSEMSCTPVGTSVKEEEREHRMKARTSSE
jgi:hypothetical protein